jgi:hypothetical protein
VKRCKVLSVVQPFGGSKINMSGGRRKAENKKRMKERDRYI